jgi:hypothetical protein
MPELREVLHLEDRLEVRQRFNFAIHLLRAAHQAAREAYDVENAHKNAEHGPWFDHMMRLVPTAVVMAAAALEANANELIQDLIDQIADESESKCKLLLEDLKGERSGDAIDRHKRLASLLLLDREPATGNSAWENAGFLVELRDSFMHFRPAWDQDGIHSGKLAKFLRNKVPVASAFEKDFRFPHGLMTYGCAKWAVQSVLAFSSEFSALLNVKDRFTPSHIDFSLPEE